MLANGEDVHPDLFGLARDLGHGVDPLRLAGRVARDGIAGDVADREDSELHLHSSWVGRIHAFASNGTDQRPELFPSWRSHRMGGDMRPGVDRDAREGLRIRMA
ncbi:hypothetical protein SDC9_179730 [bioreactor metagenome]|uniref:Uncharacterized protein n=1 Tax=bioreactor metagenome TaxID=1076179 RepID=A0A645H7K4_9ZZZZ